MEGPRAFRLRTLEANLIQGSFSAILDEDPDFTSIGGGRMTTSDWVSRLCRWCPNCLRNDASRYGRLGWEIRFADACPVCGNWLVDQCSACGSHVPWSRDRYASCRCGEPLESGSSSLAPAALGALCRALELRALGKSADELPVLNGLRLHQCLQLIRWLGTYGALTPQRTPQKLMTSDSINTTWPVTSLAAEVIADWPKGFFRFLEQLRSEGGLHLRGSLPRTFQGFYRALYAVFRGPEFIWLRNAFEDYVAEHWSGSIGRRNRRLYEKIISRLEWIPVAAAAKQLGISVAAVLRLGAHGQLDVDRYQTASGRRFSKVSTASLKHLRAQGSTESVTLMEAAKTLGLKKQRLQSLLPVICPEAFKLLPTNIWMVPQAWLAGVGARVERLPALPAAFDRQWVCLDWLLRYKAPSDRAVGELINAVLSGSMQAVREQETTCLAKVFCLRSQVQDAWSKELASPAQSITLMEASSRLQLKQEVIYALVRSGLLQADRQHVGRRHSLWLKTSELDRFCGTYVLARDLAKKWKTSSRALTKKLAACGIRPVAGPGVDNCRQLVFRASDVHAHCELSSDEAT